MSSADTADHGAREVRFFGILRKSPPLHFYLMQFIGFAYVLYRFLSRDYTVYGHFTPEMFDYPRTFGMELWPIPLLHFTTFQFIYSGIPRPTPEVIFGMHVVVAACCASGILGIQPRKCAAIVLLLALHITGMMQSSDAEVDGGGLALCTMLVLALSPGESFYRWGHSVSLAQRKTCYHWPAFLLMLVAAAFYTMAGMNKIIDVGPHWPFVLHLENLANYGIENSLFYADRYAHPRVCLWNSHPAWSYVAGVTTIVTEIGFASILFLPRYRLSLVVSLCVFHCLVFAMAGINFVGSSLILLLCLDWNAPLRSARLVYCGTNARWLRTIGLFERLNWMHTLHCQTKRPPHHDAGEAAWPAARAWLLLIDENGEVYSGLWALEQACTRCPALWPAALLFKLPGLFLALRPVFDRASGLTPPANDAVDRLRGELQADVDSTELWAA